MSNDVSHQFKKQVPKNAGMAVVASASYILSTIWLTPYLVKHLGSAAYGLIPLAGLFTQYATLITAEISQSIGRFLTIEIQRPNGTPNRTFNSALALYLGLIVLQLPLFLLGIMYADRIFWIPDGLLQDAMLLLIFSAATFLVSLLGGVFGVSLFAANRLDIGNGIVVFRLIARLVLIILFFSIKGPKLRYIGYIDFLLEIAAFLAVVCFWKKLTPQLYLSARDIDRRELKPIFKMSFWSVMNRMGLLIYKKSDIWIINRFISPLMAGKYAAIQVISHLIPQLASQVNGQLAPTIMNCWAKGDKHNLRRLLTFTLKVLAFGLTVVAALICIHGRGILHLWLGEEFVGLFMLLIIFLAHQPVNASTIPFNALTKASNKVKLPAIVSVIMGTVNLAASYYVGVVLGKGAIGVAAVTAVAVTLKDGLFTTIYASIILKLPRGAFLRPMAASVSVYGLVYLLSLVPLTHWLGLPEGVISNMLVSGAFTALICGLLGWRFLLTADEQRTVGDMLPNRMGRMLMRMSRHRN